ncbi:asparagine synthase (glutamine-hydrolyzing) [Acidovorax sp. NCPPB 3576]|uniref:asparagine synthase (glutamine-hydrolyzing) n=1 Tax=Acidovorax sp. NCPPB 3576 TaxID=2940488 RepID=UPI0023492519|nr:asparagine synthase (glutamine-hydrolyzing) [Acidovorax sp. NCPPB 3576]WCM89333.1 asparagine synthase (glutamine-hydrolyzing) [Acidovorax sp. NCPPB 3576]
MCGIAGSASGIGDGRLEGRLKAALHLLQRRGPDESASAFWRTDGAMVALGHTRLSVIDLSSAAQQPMSSSDENFTLVFNGEIYNYLELRRELEQLGRQFHSRSDTEVLLQAWQVWGERALPRLVGMFAFVLLDRRSGTLHGARDAFGIKPIYYHADHQGLCFASEIPAVQALRSSAPRLDWHVAYDYLAHGRYDNDARTFFADVRALPPGHRFTYDLQSRQLELHAWWKPTIAPVQRLTLDDAADGLRSRLLDSVRLHLRSDVPLGAALSGGLDSSAIVGCMRHLEPDAPIHTFSFIASGSSVSEEQWVDRMNAYAGAVAHKVSIAPQELAADLDDMIAAQGEPFGSTSIYAQYRVFQLAREHGMTVTLDGQGADELCGGYVGYPGPRVHSLLDEGRWLGAAAFLRQWGRWPGRAGLDGLKAAVAEYTSDTAYQALRRMNGADASPPWLDGRVLADAGVALRFPRESPPQTAPGRRLVAELARSLHGVGLPGLLRHGDRNSMRFSVESRVPFLTTGLADFLLTLPEDYLVSPQGETKHLLRRAMRGLVPQEVLDRRDKIGFATPEQAWLVQMAPQVREWLRHPLGLPFFRQDEVLRAFDQVVAGQRPFSWQVWRWINFTRWHARHFAG